MPSILVQRDAARGVEPDAFQFEPNALLAFGAVNRAATDFAARIDNPVPRHGGVVRQGVQCIADLAGQSSQVAHDGDLPIGRHASSRDALHDRVDDLVASLHTAAPAVLKLSRWSRYHCGNP